MTIAAKLRALADTAGAGLYHRVMAALGAHPKTVVFCALGVGFVVGVVGRAVL